MPSGNQHRKVCGGADRCRPQRGSKPPLFRSALWLVGTVGWFAVLWFSPELEDSLPIGTPLPGPRFYGSTYSCYLDLRMASDAPTARPLPDGTGDYLSVRCRETGARYIRFKKPVRLWGVNGVRLACPGLHPEIRWCFPWQEPELVFYRLALSWERHYDPRVDDVFAGYAPVTRIDGFWVVYAAGAPKLVPSADDPLGIVYRDAVDGAMNKSAPVGVPRQPLLGWSNHLGQEVVRWGMPVFATVAAAGGGTSQASGRAVFVRLSPNRGIPASGTESKFADLSRWAGTKRVCCGRPVLQRCRHVLWRGRGQQGWPPGRDGGRSHDPEGARFAVAEGS